MKFRSHKQGIGTESLKKVNSHSKNENRKEEKRLVVDFPFSSFLSTNDPFLLLLCQRKPETYTEIGS